MIHIKEARATILVHNYVIIVIGYISGTGMAEGLVQEGTLLVTFQNKL